MVSHVESANYPGDDYDDSWRSLVFPAHYRQPEPRERYHLVVIGAGPAGLVTAMAAARLGANVALVEKTAMGGDSLNGGCIPSKSLLEFTRHGVEADDFDDAFAWLRQVRAAIAQHDSVQRFVDAGVDVFLGAAKFLNQDTVQVGHARLVTRRTVIATGSHATIPQIEGLAEARPHTNETIFDLRRRPKRLGIIGGGPIGCELAQAFARMDVEVFLIEQFSRLLPKESPEAAAIVAGALQDAGVELRLDAQVSRITRRGALVSIEIDEGAEETVVDELLVAVGRRPNTDELNLAAVGVETDAAARIIVDRYLRTTNSHIYAAGDVCSAVQLTHNADAHARAVVRNALFLPTVRTDTLLIPRCTYTDPEIAHIGRDREELTRDSVAFDTYRIAFKELDRGRTQNDEQGFAEILTSAGSDRILGATIVGRDAGEQIASISMAMTNGLGLAAMGKAVLPYPTRAEFIRRLADDYSRTRLTPAVKRALKTWLRWRA